MKYVQDEPKQRVSHPASRTSTQRPSAERTVKTINDLRRPELVGSVRIRFATHMLEDGADIRTAKRLGDRLV